MRRLLGVPVTVLMVLATLTPTAALATIQPVSGATAARASDGPSDALLRRAAKQPLSSWTCGKWHAGSGQESGHRFCAKLSKVTPKLHVEDESVNRAKGAHTTATCGWERSVSWTFGASISSEVEAGVIFAKAKVSIEANVSRSATNSSTVSFTFPVKKGQWFHCVRGQAGFKLQGTIKKVLCGKQGCRTYWVKDFSGNVPTRAWHEAGPGKNFDLKQYLPEA
jgi:hypothetical protein